MALDANITEATSPSLFSSSVEPAPSRETFSVRQSFLLPPMLMAGRQSTLGAAGDPPSAEVQVVPLQGMMWLNNLTTTAAPASPKPMRLFPPVAFGGGKASDRGVKEVAIDAEQHIIVTYSDGVSNDLGTVGASWPEGGRTGQVLTKMGDGEVGWGSASEPIAPTQDQVNAAVAALNPQPTQAQVNTALAAFNPQISQQQINAAIATLNPQPTQAQVNTAIAAQVALTNPVVVSGLKYALPTAQTFDYPAVDNASGFTSAPALPPASTSTYTSRDLFSPFLPTTASYIKDVVGTPYRFKSSIAVTTRDGVSLSLSEAVGRKVRQRFDLGSPMTAGQMTLYWARAAGRAGADVVDSTYHIRLFDANDVLIRAWDSFKVSGSGQSIAFPFTSPLTIQSGTLEIEVAELYPTRSTAETPTIFSDFNSYPPLGPAPAGKVLLPAQDETGADIKNNVGEALVMTSPLFTTPTIANAPATFIAQEDGVRVALRGSRAMLNFPSLPRAGIKRKGVVIFTPILGELLTTTSVDFVVTQSSLEELQAGLRNTWSTLFVVQRLSGQNTFTVVGAPNISLPANARLRVEWVTERSSVADYKYFTAYSLYNDISGVKLQSGTALSTNALGVDGRQMRYLFSPTVVNTTNLCAVDDFVIHRWTEWSES